MKIVCITNKRSFPWLQESERQYINITIGKIYDVIKMSSTIYEIIGDDGVTAFYNKENFKPLTEIRQEKLNQLGL